MPEKTAGPPSRYRRDRRATEPPGDDEGQKESLRRMVALLEKAGWFGAVGKDAKPE